jgi:insertion element IS1 protein InsB
VAFHPFKKNKKWIIKALDRSTRRTVAWVIGGRDAATFKRLYDKVKHLKNGLFFTDNGETFAKVLPKDRPIVSKKCTIAIEQDNSNTRHHLARMTRRTKVVSHCETMLDASLKLWLSLTTPEIFAWYQKRALSIFK